MAFLPSVRDVFDKDEINRLERRRKLAALQDELAERSRSRPLGAFLDPDQAYAAETARARSRARPSRSDLVDRDVMQSLSRAIKAQGEPNVIPQGRGSVAAARANFESGMRRMEGRVAEADLQAILAGRERPRRELAGSAGGVPTLRGVRKIGRLGAGGRAQEAAPSQDVSEAAGERDLRARRQLAETRQAEEQAKEQEALRRQQEQAARSPLEREQDFAAVRQFRGRKGVQEGPPTVRGVRRFGTTVEPVEPPGDPEQEMLERLISGGTDIPSNVAQSLISRGTQRERLEVQQSIRDANDRLQRELADAGADLTRQREARLRWQAEVTGTLALAGALTNAQRFGQEGGFMGFGQQIEPGLSEQLDEIRRLLQQGPGRGGGGGANEPDDLSQLSDEELRRIIEGR